MATKCANRCCTATRNVNEGKLFRLDLDLGSKTGGDEHRTEYMWLCSDCAQRMHPRVEVSGDTIRCGFSRTPDATGRRPLAAAPPMPLGELRQDRLPVGDKLARSMADDAFHATRQSFQRQGLDRQTRFAASSAP